MSCVEVDLTSTVRAWRLRRSLLEYCNDAAAVMLDRYHPPPAPPARGVLRRHGEEVDARVRWHPPEPGQLESHANHIEATEHGAYGVVFAAVHAVERYVVARRADHASGADYLLVREGEPENDFVKLEVSGMAKGSEAQLRQRVADKLAQIRAGTLRRPGVVVVVRFDDATIVVQHGAHGGFR